jgi:hypothetical protein
VAVLETDWITHFLPAIQRLLHGGDMYKDIFVLNPPWTFFILSPAGLLPNQIAVWVGTILPIIALFYAARKMRKAYLIAIIGLTFPFIELCAYGNLDWMVLLGAITTSTLSPFLLTVKPQAGALAVVGQLGKMKGKSWKEYVKVFGPFVIIGTPMLFIFPGFIHNFLIVNDRLPGLSAANFSLFPYTIPLAIPLLWFSYKRSEPLYGALASLCISPYFYFHSVIPSLFLIANKNWKWGIAANLFTWAIFVLILIHVIPIKF